MQKDFAVLCFPDPTKVRRLLMPIASRLGCFWQTLQEDLGLQPQTTPENWDNCLNLTLNFVAQLFTLNTLCSVSYAQFFGGQFFNG